MVEVAIGPTGWRRSSAPAATRLPSRSTWPRAVFALSARSPCRSGAAHRRITSWP